MPDVDNKQALGSHEIIPPGKIQRILTPEERQKRRLRFTVAGISAAFLLGLLLWGLNQYLSLRGVVHVLASRIILALMWPIGTLLLVVLLWQLDLKKWLKLTCTLVAALIIAILLLSLERWTLKLAEQSPPTKEELLAVSVSANLGVPPDANRGSIEWRPEYVYIRLMINDPGPTDLDGLDMKFSFNPGFVIVAMDQTTKFAGVSMFADPPLRGLSASIFTTDKNGNRIEIPAYVGKTSSSGVWRVRCDHVPRQSFIEFVAAGAVLNIPNGFSAWKENKEYGPKRVPSVLNVEGSYKVGPKSVKFANTLQLRPLS